ncbi:cyclic nucleotide-binding domain protein (macronuclear) [Tetrahymena thermophila SB210]|uniref:Cyclic nucleotide-binding domain protein n=1 Tax=Tetrahymena thermophila (strain SB210) TaxID=312017 RepID=I7LXU3_TETTS|nr:cyclic nucleotide-binding domain protein [Tetrahymena thermophila SB210]EAS06206.2 cyclic nucleotide-binding domain protein [Tetrahymena thermophila SB210]|eukprot:XP_001026451.2 cyclic nucleotide-binding domain protein [Tetrahymena thermophila SB210]
MRLRFCFNFLLYHTQFFQLVFIQYNQFTKKQKTKAQIKFKQKLSIDSYKMLNGKSFDKISFVKKLFLSPPQERQLDEIGWILDTYNFNSIHTYNIGLKINNEFYQQDMKDLHQLIVQHMQYNYYETTHKIIKQKDSCKFNCFLIVEGQVNIYETSEDGELLYTFKYGDVFTDKEIIKSVKKTLVFVFAAHSHVGQTKYEDIQDTLESSNYNLEEKNNKFLQYTYLLQKLNIKYFKELIQNLSYLDFLNGETVFQQADPIDSFYIIKSGEFSIKRSFSIQEFHKKGSMEVEIGQSDKEFEELLLNKKNNKKSLQLRVMIQNEIFGEEELIKSYYQELQSNPNQVVPKDFNVNLQRSYQVQCCSTQGTLIKISKEDLFKKILSKMKYYQIQDLITRIDAKLKNSENKVRKIRRSIIPFKQYLISDSPSSNDLSNYTRRHSQFSQQASAQLSHQNSTNNSLVRTSTPNTQSHRQTRPSQSTQSLSQTSKIIAFDSFSDQILKIQKGKSQPEFSQLSPTCSINTQRGRPYSARCQNKEGQSIQESRIQISKIRNNSARPVSSSIFCQQSKNASKGERIEQKQIQSFLSLEQQSSSILHHLDFQQSASKDHFCDQIKESQSKLFAEDKTSMMMIKKRFSVFEKSTLETSFYQQGGESQIKSPRMKIQLGINQSQDLTNQEKRFMKFQDQIQKKVEQNHASQKPVFVEFVPVPNPKNQEKTLNQKGAVSPTYQGLNSHVVEKVKDRKMKIQLIQPIFDRGYAENFNKELIKINKKNAKHNYIVDVKEDNMNKGLNKFNILQQIIEKQNKLKQMQSLHKENQSNTNNAFHMSNLLQASKLDITQTNLLNKENFQSYNIQASESIIIQSYPKQTVNKLSINTNINNSQNISSPLISPKLKSYSAQVSPKTSPLQNKQIKSAVEMLSQLVEKKFHHQSSTQRFQQPIIRAKSQSVKHSQSNQFTFQQKNTNKYDQLFKQTSHLNGENRKKTVSQYTQLNSPKLNQLI